MSMARLTFPSRLELNRLRRVFQRGALGKGQLDDLLVRLSGADDAAVGEDGSPHPLPLFDDLRVCLVDDLRALSRASCRASPPVP